MPSLDSAVDVLHVFGDATRVRLLSLLAREELSVAELTSILELPQSRISTHLGRLKDAGLLRDRKVGASTRYAVNDGAMPEQARGVWELLSAQLDDRVLEADRRRSSNLRRARQRAESWPESIAGEMERHYSPGRTWEATARGLLGFVQLGDVLDVGAGDGAIAALLSSRSGTYTCLDKSERMIEAARKRLSSQPNIQFAVGDMHRLPFAAASFDHVLLFNTLPYAEEPERALRASHARAARGRKACRGDDRGSRARGRDRGLRTSASRLFRSQPAPPARTERARHRRMRGHLARKTQAILRGRHGLCDQSGGKWPRERRRGPKRTIEETPMNDARALIQKLCEQRILVLDGAMGTVLQKLLPRRGRLPRQPLRESPARAQGQQRPARPDAPEIVREIHAAYLAAGSDIIRPTRSAATTHLAGRLSASSRSSTT